MKKKLVCALIAVGMLTMVGCSEEKDKGNEANAKPQVEEQAGDESSKGDEDSKDKEDEKTEETAAKIENGEFAIYIGNDNIDGVKVGDTIKTQNLTVEENLKKIAEELGKKNFEGCTVEIAKMEKEGNKTIATVNLKDGSKKWEKDYLQGSTGAFITEEILINSLLQPDNKIEWIDSIKFTINGENVGELNHAPRIGQTVNRVK